MARFTITRTFEIDTNAWNEHHNVKYPPPPMGILGFLQSRLDEAIDRFVEETPGIECDNSPIDLSDITL